jgi:hypothetical protein
MKKRFTEEQIIRILQEARTGTKVEELWLVPMLPVPNSYSHHSPSF